MHALVCECVCVFNMCSIENSACSSYDNFLSIWQTQKFTVMHLTYIFHIRHKCMFVWIWICNVPGIHTAVHCASMLFSAQISTHSPISVVCIIFALCLCANNTFNCTQTKQFENNGDRIEVNSHWVFGGERSCVDIAKLWRNPINSSSSRNRREKLSWVEFLSFEW